MFIVCVNVLFLSNSQLTTKTPINNEGVYRMCQCPLFKQFTTGCAAAHTVVKVFIVCVNVLFLSNSQRQDRPSSRHSGCLSYVSMSSF